MSRSRKPRAKRVRRAGIQKLRPLKLPAALVKTGALLTAALLLTSCSIYPTTPAGRAAEATWLAIDAIDTAQTAQLVRHRECMHEADPFARTIYGGGNPPPAKVVAINVLLAPVHSMVSRWFDDHAERAYQEDRDSAALWSTARFAWHFTSIAFSGSSVVHNYVDLGVTPFGARCDR